MTPKGPLAPETMQVTLALPFDLEVLGTALGEKDRVSIVPATVPGTACRAQRGMLEFCHFVATEFWGSKCPTHFLNTTPKRQEHLGALPKRFSSITENQ